MWWFDINCRDDEVSLKDEANIMTIKKSQPRSEFKSVSLNHGNFLIIKFHDGNNSNEYHVYAEVGAKEIAKLCVEDLQLDVEITDSDTTRSLWDKVWKEL